MRGIGDGESLGLLLEQAILHICTTLSDILDPQSKGKGRSKKVSTTILVMSPPAAGSRYMHAHKSTSITAHTNATSEALKL